MPTFKKLNIFQEKIGLMTWATWLAESKEDRLVNSPVLGQGKTISESRLDFADKLEQAIENQEISIFEGNVILIDPSQN